MSGDMSGRPPVESRPIPDDLRSDVLDIMSDAMQWRLPEARWAGVENQVQALDVALQAGDLAALEAALGDLELAAPLRITPIGGEPTVPVPPRLRNLARDVVHNLGEGLELDTRGSADHQRDKDGPKDAAGR
jgi:hypothetical protein